MKLKIIISATLSLTFSAIFAQVNFDPIQPSDYDNRAQAYAILAAQYSNYGYQFARRGQFGKIEADNLDTALVMVEIAREYADSALLAGHDSIIVAEAHMEKSRQLLTGSISRCNRIRSNTGAANARIILTKLVYDLGYATNYAYYASLFINGEFKLRDTKRLEMDEYTFSTAKEMYEIRLVEVKEEIERVKQGKGKVNEMLLDALEDEKKDLELKLQQSGEQLLAIRQAWSKEVFSEVDNMVFTTEKQAYYSEDNPIPEEVGIPKGLVYRVQLGFFSDEKPDDAFEGVFPISVEKEQKVDKIYLRYVAGIFDKYEYARSARDKLAKNSKFTDAFVIAYFDGKRIPVSQAVKKERGN